MTSKGSIPEVSVVIPVYRIGNEALQRCIDSVRKQTLEDIEIILVNDGSTPEDLEVCLRAAQSDPRVRLISHENSGVSVCRNEGIESARADWIAFVDGDDRTEPTYLERLLQVARETSADIVLCDCYVDYARTQVENRFFSEDRLDSDVVGKERFTMQFLCPRYYRDSCGVTDSGAPWCRLYRRQLLLDKGLRYRPELRRMQDNVFNLYAYEAAERIVYFHEPLYHYRKSSSSGFSRYEPRIADFYRLVFEAMEEFLERTGKSEIYRQGFYAKIVFSYYVLLKMDLANRSNPEPYSRRRKRASRILQDRFYRMALSRGEAKYRTGLENLFAIVMKLGLVDILFLMYRCKEWLWKRKGKGIE